MLNRLLIIFSIVILFSATGLSQKNDTLVHINRNIITGEIKKIEYGLVYYSTNGMGTLKIEIDKVLSLKSDKQFQIILDNGLIYFGSLDTVNSAVPEVKIISKDRIFIVKTNSLVEVFPLKNTFGLRLSGDFSVGGSYKKSTGILQLSNSGNLYYRSKKNYYRLNWDNQVTLQNDSIISEKKSDNISYRRYYINHFSLQAQLGASSNLELNLKSRYYLNLIVGKDIVHTNRSEFYTGLGLSGNRENHVDSKNNSNNIEGIMVISYDFFKRNDPEVNIKNNVDVYPSFTSIGRWRVDASLDARIEVFNDFFLGMKVYYNFDNSVDVDNYGIDDWGVNGTISYSFH